MPRVEGHRRSAVGEAGFHAADDGTAAAEGDDGDPLAGAPVEEVGDVLLGAGAGDEVGGVAQVALEVADDVPEGFAVGVRGAVARGGGAQVGQ